VVSWICTFPGIWFLERFGRRRPLIYGGLWQSELAAVFDVHLPSVVRLITLYSLSGGWLFVYAITGTIKDPETFPTLSSTSEPKVKYSYGFVFAGANFVGVLVVYFFLKEGSGLSLEHLAALWEDGSTPVSPFVLSFFPLIPI